MVPVVKDYDAIAAFSPLMHPDPFRPVPLPPISAINGHFHLLSLCLSNSNNCSILLSFPHGHELNPTSPLSPSAALAVRALKNRKRQLRTALALFNLCMCACCFRTGRMLTCVACSKQHHQQLDDGSHQQRVDDDTAATPRTKQAIKALTSQIKDVALKASGAYRNCKPCSGSNSNHRHNYADSDTASDSAQFRCSYRRAGSATPWLWSKEMDTRMKVLSSGETTPASVSGRPEPVVFMEEDEPKEWVAQVEPGVLITFVSLPQGGNDLKRIRFSREMFNKWQAQKWWTENYEKVMELYNVQHSNHQAAPLSTPPRSEDEDLRNDSTKDSSTTPALCKERQPDCLHLAGKKFSSSESLDRHPMRSQHYNGLAGLATTPKVSSISAAKTETSSLDGSISSGEHSGELSVSNTSDMETEWVEEDEPGVYITIRALPGGMRELRRVRFSREKFNEMHARLWWEENRARIQEQYL